MPRENTVSYLKSQATAPPPSSSTAYTQSRIAFESRPSIFVPESEVHGSSWAEPQDCLWDTPIPIVTKHTLAGAYKSVFSPSDDSLATLERFFVSTLGIPTCTWEHVVAEIRHYSVGVLLDDLDLNRARELYKCLFEMRLEGAAARDLKYVFFPEWVVVVTQAQLVADSP